MRDWEREREYERYRRNVMMREFRQARRMQGADAADFSDKMMSALVGTGAMTIFLALLGFAGWVEGL